MIWIILITFKKFKESRKKSSTTEYKRISLKSKTKLNRYFIDQKFEKKVNKADH